MVALLQRGSSCHRVARLIGTRSALAILLGRHGMLPLLLLLVTVTLAGPGSCVMVGIGRSGWGEERIYWQVRSQKDYRTKEYEEERD